MAIQQENELIQLLETFVQGNNLDKEVKLQVKQQILYAERRIQDLEYIAHRRRERKSFVRRVEEEVGQEKLRQYFTQHGLAHLYPNFRKMTLRDFQKSDTLDWPSLSESDLRMILYLR